MATALKSWGGGNPADAEWTVVSRSGRYPYTAPTPPRRGDEPKPAPTVGEIEEATVGLEIRNGSGRLEKYDIPVELSCDGVPAPAEEFEEAVFRNVARCGYEIPTLVQHYSMPITLAKRGLMACVQTGSGKTASFQLPVVSGLVAAVAGGAGGSEGAHRDRAVYDRAARSLALVLAPTRDLAAQVLDVKSLIWSKIDDKTQAQVFPCAGHYWISWGNAFSSIAGYTEDSYEKITGI